MLSDSNIQLKDSNKFSERRLHGLVAAPRELTA